jgi:hypothetical protein
MDALATDPWRTAARSIIEHGQAGPGHPAHLEQHPMCAVAGQQETVYTRCCGKPILLGRPMWPCEMPADAGMSLDCCGRPFVMFGEG